MFKRLTCPVLAAFALILGASPAVAVDPWATWINGCYYERADFEGFKYSSEEACTGIRPLAFDLAQEFANAWVGTSGSSLTISTGTKTLLLTSGRAFAIGQPVRIKLTSTAADQDFMDGIVTDWDAELFSMEVEVDAVDATSGAGPFTSWSVFVVRSESTVVSGPLAVADGGTAATTALGARQNLGVTETRFYSSRTNTPPGSPADGEAYLVGTSATGAWSGHEDEYTYWDDGGSAWVFQAPSHGDVVFIEQDAVEHQSTVNGSNTRTLLWDEDVGRWFGPPGPAIHHVISASVEVTPATLSGRPSAIFLKTSNSAFTLTLSGAFGALRFPVVTVANTGTSDITVNVTGGGTVNGGASVAVAQNTARSFVHVAAAAWRSVSVY